MKKAIKQVIFMFFIACGLSVGTGWAYQDENIPPSDYIKDSPNFIAQQLDRFTSDKYKTIETLKNAVFVINSRITFIHCANSPEMTQEKALETIQQKLPSFMQANKDFFVKNKKEANKVLLDLFYCDTINIQNITQNLEITKILEDCRCIVKQEFNKISPHKYQLNTSNIGPAATQPRVEQKLALGSKVKTAIILAGLAAAAYTGYKYSDEIQSGTNQLITTCSSAYQDTDTLIERLQERWSIDGPFIQSFASSIYENVCSFWRNL